MSNSNINKASRKSISLSDKLNIVSKLENGCPNAQICRAYGLSKSTVSTIWAQRAKYLGAQRHASPSVKKIRQPKRQDVDKALLEWVSLKRSQNVPLSGPVLQEKADQLARLSANDPDDFSCTRGWVDRFKKRHNIGTGKIHGEAGAVSPEITDKWLTTEGPGIGRGYPDKDIFNGDATHLFFTMTPDRTFKFKEEKSKSSRCFKSDPKLPVSYEGNKRAWMTSDILPLFVQMTYPECEKFAGPVNGLENIISKEILSKRMVQSKITDFFPCKQLVSRT